MGIESAHTVIRICERWLLIPQRTKGQAVKVKLVREWGEKKVLDNWLTEMS